MSLETVCFSIYSDISSRMRLSTLSNRSDASRLTSSVLPTPVGPTKMKDTGFFLGEIPTRLRRMARETASTASSWPTMCSFRRRERPLICSYSWALILEAGIFVHISMILARFSMVTVGLGSASSSSILAASCMSLLRIRARRS